MTNFYVHVTVTYFFLLKDTQSIPSARLSVQSSELAPTTSTPAKECCSSPPLGPRGETHSLGEGEGEGGGVDPIPTKGQTLCMVLYNPSTLKDNLYVGGGEGLLLTIY